VLRRAAEHAVGADDRRRHFRVLLVCSWLAALAAQRPC
jgi:hypothetical protein